MKKQVGKRRLAGFVLLVKVRSLPFVIDNSAYLFVGKSHGTQMRSCICEFTTPIMLSADPSSKQHASRIRILMASAEPLFGLDNLAAVPGIWRHHLRYSVLSRVAALSHSL